MSSPCKIFLNACTVLRFILWYKNGNRKTEKVLDACGTERINVDKNIGIGTTFIYIPYMLGSVIATTKKPALYLFSSTNYLKDTMAKWML